MIGRRYGTTHRAARRPREAGIGFFCDEQGSTTVASAVAILVSLALVFSLANVQWASSRAADVQVVADAGALAGANVVAAYVTIAQILDALVLSMGLIGLLTMAVGLVLSAIPVVDAAGPPVLSAASNVFSARSKLSRSCAAGLQKLESVVPYAVFANSAAVIRTNASSEGSYVGFALPYPVQGSSDFGNLESDDAQTSAEELEKSGERVDELSKQAAQNEQDAADALERAWMADCGGAVSMRERASTLAGLAGSQNPTYPSAAGWDFGVAIRRASAYYAQRAAIEVPESASVEERARSQARRVFYAYAYEQVSSSTFVRNADGSVVCDLHALPRNTAEMRTTSLYTQAVWPLSREGSTTRIHAFAGCPGALGSSSGTGSLAQLEAGSFVVCPVCSFSASTLGRVPAASTSIDNGFEYYWKIVVDESQAYQAAKEAANEKFELARQEGERSSELFRDVLTQVAATRVTLNPPGAKGCVCVCVDPASHASPASLLALFDEGVEIPSRAALSAAVLVPDKAQSGNNILANFFDALVVEGGAGSGASGVLDSVLTVWGNVLVAYGNGYDALSGAMKTSFQTLSSWGMGGISSWLKDALTDAVDLLAIKPADMSAKKPVLTNSSNILSEAGGAWYSAIRSIVSSMSGQSGPVGLLSELTGGAISYDGQGSITLGQLEIPGTGNVRDLTIDLSWLAGAA